MEADRPAELLNDVGLLHLRHLAGATVDAHLRPNLCETPELLHMQIGHGHQGLRSAVGGCDFNHG